MAGLPLSLFQLLLDTIDIAFSPQPNCDTAHFLQRWHGYLAGSDVPLERNPAHANFEGCLLCGVSFHDDIDLYHTTNRFAREFVSYVCVLLRHTPRNLRQYRDTTGKPNKSKSGHDI